MQRKPLRMLHHRQVNKAIRSRNCQLLCLFDTNSFCQLCYQVHVHVFEDSVLQETLEVHSHVKLESVDEFRGIKVRCVRE